jgi:hypothetical protein
MDNGKAIEKLNGALRGEFLQLGDALWGDSQSLERQARLSQFRRLYAG